MKRRKKLMIIVVDRDNDIYEKARMSGPIIGREANLNAAIKLALADPQDTDANALFQAIKLYDELSEKYDVVLVTLTGSKKLGYAADKNISSQLDRVLSEHPVDECMVVTDGADDEVILPIIESRVKISSVKVVVMKQAKELEKTYVVLLEKLRDPYYAKIIFGIPAILLLISAFASYMHWGWEPIAVVIAVYLIQRLLGIDEKLGRLVSSFQFSVESSSFLLYLTSLTLILVSIWTGYQGVLSASHDPLNTPLKTVARAIQGMFLLLPWGLLLAIAGKMLDYYKDKNKIGIIRMGFYAIATVLLWTVLSAMADWIVLSGPPYVSFEDLILIVIVSVVVGYAAITTLHRIRVHSIMRMKLENKEMIDVSGVHIGKIIGIDRRSNRIIVQGPFSRRTVPLEAVVDASDKVIIRL
ncbi:DUF373 family protein [Candidatus Micrarchaeota archaeon]|nr:DUF373 family protein [Candidatus Micrarchaeota archaeon]